MIHRAGNIAVCIGGVPGSGKTTLLRAHVEKETRDIQITGSSIVKAIIAPSSVSDLDSWAPEQRQAVRAQAIQELHRIQEESTGRLLVDGHFTLRNRTTGALESIFTPEDKAFFGALILIHPQPDFVLARRKDDYRYRRIESIEEIASHIQFEFEEGKRLAKEMDVPLLEITDRKLSHRLHSIANFLNVISPLRTI